MAKRCGNCGSVNLNVKDQIGRRFPWRDFGEVKLGVALPLTECLECGELIVKDNEVEAIEAAIRETVTSNIRSLVAKIIDRERCSQVAVAVHLGVSEEYLCELKSGRKIPKFQTYNFLKTLALESKAFHASNPKIQYG